MRHYQLLPLNFGNQITQNINSIYLIEFMGIKKIFLTQLGIEKYPQYLMKRD
jgi:hypothetical protein